MNPQNIEQRHTLWQNIREWIQTIVIALIIAIPIRYFIAEPFIVSGASMDPTFNSGQFLIVDRISYRLGEPERNDVIIFKYPNDPSTYYIKRIIGLPGETIKIIDGKITIINKDNPEGMVLNEPFISSAHLSYDSLDRTLGPTEYFVMGDNRAESSDSRVWGALDEHFIIGKPVIRLFPFNAISIKPGEYHDKK